LPVARIPILTGQPAFVSATFRARIDLSFPGAGRYQALAVNDDPAGTAAVKLEKTSATRGTTLAVDLRAAAGLNMGFQP
jgi:hypothetical protein